MDKKQFKSVLKKCLVEIGFVRYRTWYVLDCEELFFAIKDERSNFSELYYIECGIFVKSRWQDNSYKEEGYPGAEIRIRVGFCEPGEHDEISYEKQLRKELEEKVLPLIKNDEKYLRKVIWSDKGKFLLIMPLEEKALWNEAWQKRAKELKGKNEYI